MNPKPYIPLLIILIFCISLLAIYAFIDFKIQIEPFELKKAELSELISYSFQERANQKVFSKEQDSLSILRRLGRASFIEKEKGICDSLNSLGEKNTPIDSSRQRILLVGDSMGQSIYFALQEYCKASGHSLFLEAVESSTLVWWAKNDTLAKLIEKYDPTYVIISLGSNELFVPYIQKRQTYLDKIIAQIGNIPFVWIGPPNWKEDTGINAMLQNTLGLKKLFLSKDLQMPRLKDGIHPTWKGAYYWADTIASWIMHHSHHPILLKKKDSPSKKALPNSNTVNLIFAPTHPAFLRKF